MLGEPLVTGGRTNSQLRVGDDGRDNARTIPRPIGLMYTGPSYSNRSIVLTD